MTIKDDGEVILPDSFIPELEKNIPADVLKIDRSLLSSNCASEKERIVLESIFNV